MRLKFGAASLLALGACAVAAPALAQERASPPVIVPAPPIMVPQPGPPPRPSVITNPTWARAPRARYPDRALSRDIEGRVRLECMVQPNGRLTNCSILSENPVGYGFGSEALIAATETAMVSPRTVDGAAVAARVTFNVDFRLADPPPPPVPEAKAKLQP